MLLININFTVAYLLDTFNSGMARKLRKGLSEFSKILVSSCFFLPFITGTYVSIFEVGVKRVINIIYNNACKERDDINLIDAAIIYVGHVNIITKRRRYTKSKYTLQ